MVNLYLFIRYIEDRVEIICCVATVSIAAAEAKCACMHTLGHGALSKMSAVGRNGREMSGVNGGIDKNLRWEKWKTSGVI